MKISADEFKQVSDLIKLETGNVLDIGKEYLVETRLLPLLEREGVKTIKEMIGILAKVEGKVLKSKVIDSLTTHETSFFRDLEPFNALRDKVLPDLIEKRKSSKSITIWCGAASSGQEPYSIAMLIRDHFPQLAQWNVKIIATDISVPVLERAKTGVFSQLEVNRGLPITMLVKYFEQIGRDWKLRPSVTQMVSFHELNLLGAWSIVPDCDIVFLRNVLIYFDIASKKKILEQIHRVLRKDGTLFLGSAESTLTIDQRFKCKPVGKAQLYGVG
jgi:chemotaxis protein methyltransferase CheR